MKSYVRLRRWPLGRNTAARRSLPEPLPFTANQNKAIKAWISSCMLNHRRSHGVMSPCYQLAIWVFRESGCVCVDWEFFSTLIFALGTGQWHKHEPRSVWFSGSLRKHTQVRRTQRSFMQPKRFHVHAGNNIWLCAGCYQQAAFLLGEYFKVALVKNTRDKKAARPIWRNYYHQP